MGGMRIIQPNGIGQEKKRQNVFFFLFAGSVFRFFIFLNATDKHQLIDKPIFH